MVRYATGTTGSAYPSFPFIRERIDENPARWLQYCEDGPDHRVTSLLNGMRSRERALNWQYVAEQMDVHDAVQDNIAALVGEGVTPRAVAHTAAPRLRELWHADTPEAVRELLAAEVEGESRSVVVALANHRLDAFDAQSDDDEAGDVVEADSEGDESTVDVSAPTREEITPADYDEDDYDSAVEFCESFDAETLRGFLQKEQRRDEPRPAKLAALIDVIDEKTDTMTTTDETATAVTGTGA